MPGRLLSDPRARALKFVYSRNNRTAVRLTREGVEMHGIDIGLMALRTPIFNIAVTC
jgi:hypothetical protein